MFVTPYTDAMSLDWNCWNSIYLFPPVKSLLLVLSYLPRYQGQVIIIAPWWLGQSWFPTLLDLWTNPKEFPRAALSQEVQGQTVL